MKKAEIRTFTAVLLAVFMPWVMCACQNKDSGSNVVQEKPTETEGEVYINSKEGYATAGKYAGDWRTVTFDNGSDRIPYSELEQYKDTGVTIEVDFTLEESDYYVLGIADASNMDNKLYAVDRTYITGIIPYEEAYNDKQIPQYYVSMQSDGFVSFSYHECINSGSEYNCMAFTFTITPEAIEYLKDSKGIVFQTYGVNVRKVILDTDELDAKIR